MAAGVGDGPEVVGKPNKKQGTTDQPFDLAAVVSEYESPLLRYVARLIGNRDDEAQDVVQEVFLKLHRQIARRGGDNIDNLRCWLYRVAHNAAMDHGRARQRRKALAEQALSDPTVMERLTARRLPDANDCARREAAQTALAAVDELPEEQKTVVLLKVMQGLTLKEISRITEIKIGTVNYRLTQGLRGLAAQLKETGA